MCFSWESSPNGGARSGRAVGEDRRSLDSKSPRSEEPVPSCPDLRCALLPPAGRLWEGRKKLHTQSVLCPLCRLRPAVTTAPPAVLRRSLFWTLGSSLFLQLSLTSSERRTDICLRVSSSSLPTGCRQRPPP